ncbi:calmodulin-binding transcription activator 5 [Phtheirospermum japonicum]|uniref:Calmodulin-binding transcription activator 5 n=1 Tax=Phtheirospermum japonicum TaxID=374723 RepID=A0A830BIM5_9LAMI|nr:calmodulin-binding transcription activator 5 [Phtheirospermum japonicum]
MIIRSVAMESNRLVGSEIHGFRTMEDLDFGSMMEEAKTRWLRPNEIHAILCNHKYFTVHVKPMNLPKSGTIVLFDRKKLRNFRKDGLIWKKKKDGKTVKEAHEHLKVGDKERIHVYYAHGEDNPTFVRRCYWLLDKSLEYIVLVHYRETQEGSPATPENSTSNSAVSDPSAAWHLLGESDTMVNREFDNEHHPSATVENHEQRLHEINTLEWDELLVPDNPNKLITLQEDPGKVAGFEPTNQHPVNSYNIIDDALTTNKVSPESSNSPGSVDGQTLESSISTGYIQSFTSSPMDNHMSSAPDQIFNIIDVSPSWALSTEETKMRLARLLFSPSLSLTMLSSKLSQSAVKEAKAFAQKTSHVSDSLVYFTKMIEDAKMPFPQAKDSLFELTLQNRLREWLLERVVAGSKVSEYDEQGLGVIHLCAILDYTWSVVPYSCSGLSMDYRDKKKMVAALLSAGAKPNLVTDPTSENPSGSTPADLASKNGYDGLAGYLSEKALVTQFNEMTLAGNASGSLQNHSYDVNPGFPNEEQEEIYLRDTLAAYRTAADAAARIHSAFREHSFKMRTEAAEASNPEMDARSIVAAMKIQHAFRRFETRKEMAAALRIQYRFRTWKVRKDFLSMRRHAVRIQYRKIVWSVGIFEKAVLRWRLKRKGLRGLKVQSDPTLEDPNKESDAEEEFFRASRKQAEERIERSVVNVQAMFRSRRAQEDYRRMKLEHNKATLEYEGLLHPDANMG